MTPLALSVAASSVALSLAQSLSLSESVSPSLAVYGSSGAACVAAIAASRSGASDVMLLSQTNHVGGMLTGGLMHTDSANDTVIQGITREFFIRTEQQYPGRPTGADYPPGHSPPGWLFEAKVGERVLYQMLQEANVTVTLSVGGVLSVDMAPAASLSPSLSPTISSVAFENNLTVSAPMWVDASYEGGIVEKVTETAWGREAKTVYGENSAGAGTLASIGATVNPYWDATLQDYDVPSNVIPHVAYEAAAAVGDGDLWLEPYDFRLCFTDSPGNKLNFTRPDSYNASEFELWRRIYTVNEPKTLAEAGLSCLGPIPNNYSDCGSKPCRKCDMLGMNHGTDMTDGSWGYPNGTIAERRAIWRKHIEFTRGLLWFWMSDEAVPVAVREELAQYGHCTDEYDADSDPPHWPHQLYVREAKRVVGDWVWTEFVPNATMTNRSIGLGSYNFDSHYVSRVIHRTGNAKADTVMKEGRVNVPTEQPLVPTSGLGFGCIDISTEPRCVAGVAGTFSNDSQCGGTCRGLLPNEWLAVQALSVLSDNDTVLKVRLPAGQATSWLKKSEQLADTLPDALKMEIRDGQVFNLSVPASIHVGATETYYLVQLDSSGVNAQPTAKQDHTAVPVESELGGGAGKCSVCMVQPFVMPYDAMLLKRADAGNILSPVAVSASHVRYNAVRMEPTWMLLGHAAGTAAAQALLSHQNVQDIDVAQLQATLWTQKQLLTPTQGLP